MRTMVDIFDSIYRKLKCRAASEGTSISELILRGARSVPEGSTRKFRKRIKLPIIRSKESGVLALDNEKIFEIISFP